MDEEQQRIKELQATVVNFRRELPKTYRKLMEIDYKHFHTNLKQGECEIAPKLLNVSLNIDALAEYLHVIFEDDTNKTHIDDHTKTLLQRKTFELRTARRLLASRMRRKPSKGTFIFDHQSSETNSADDVPKCPQT